MLIYLSSRVYKLYFFFPACTCDGIGAFHNVCNHVTGDCVCKPYVTGMNCSACQVRNRWYYYEAGFSVTFGIAGCRGLAAGFAPFVPEEKKPLKGLLTPNTRLFFVLGILLYSSYCRRPLSLLKKHNSCKCTLLQPNSYNFTSSGCMACGCNEFGSNSLQCNDSGICECKNHTLGEKCDLCEWGFFGLPNATCQGRELYCFFSYMY